MARKNDGWHPEKIKAELRILYGSLRAVAEKLGVRESAVSGVIRSPTESTRTERLVAELLGVALHELWPDRWTVDGRPIRRTGKAIPCADAPSVEPRSITNDVAGPCP
jgi:Ner family transcriptional regulator